MRSFAFYIVCFLIVLSQADGWAQIGMGGGPHPSAVLDLKSPNNDKAFYPPRLTSAQRLAIPNPQAGAMVYDTDKGALYLHNGQNWLLLSTTAPNVSVPFNGTASDGTAEDNFGIEVAIEGDYALVSAFTKTIGSNQRQGAVYVFVRSGSSWTQQQRLTASDGEAYSYFGSGIALSGNYALVGTHRGVAYVFMRSGTTWIQQQRLTSNDWAAGDRFGTGVALSGEYALVGAPQKALSGNSNHGAAYVFVRSGTTWVQQQRLTASDGGAGDYFGNNITLSGEYALVGAYGKTIGNNSGQGAAYVFMRSGSNWSQQQQLLASDGGSGDAFGYSIALSGEYILVGAGSKTINSNERQGAAYVYMRSGTTWSQQQRLTNSDGAAFDRFGGKVALLGEYALLGAYGKTIGSNRDQGAAYIFMRSGTTWSQQQRFTDNSPAGTQTGSSVGLSNGTYIIGGSGYQNFQGKVTFGTVN